MHSPDMKFEVKHLPSQKGEITLVTITNSKGAQVTLSSLGACLVSAIMPDAKGEMADVVLGYADPTDYFYDGPCAGKVPGRCANRIARGRFTLDGKEYNLAINNGPNALHGGPEGFQNQIWDVAIDEEEQTVTFTYHAKDGEEGYPGNVEATVEYSFTEANELWIRLEATTDAPTLVNLTNHTYFNLAGHNSGTVLNHLLQLDAHLYLPTDDTLIPTGNLEAVKGTPMDFTTAKPLGQDIKADFPALNYGKGYDNCYLVDEFMNPSDEDVPTVARLTDPTSGRVLEVATTQPGVQIYTGNWLAGSPKNKEGRSYEDYEGVAIECQGLPDSVNHPQFPTVVLRPEETYEHYIIFRFTNK